MQRIALVLVVLLGVMAGVLLTLRSVTPKSALVATHLGPWRFASHIGAPDADPYVRGRLFLSGELPVASGQGFTLRAYEDSDHATLDRRCTYSLASPFPVARYFTLTLTDKDGRVVANALDRHSFTSAEILRAEDGSFAVLIAPQPLPGNWLPNSGQPGPFVLDLRFYDPPLSATATQLNPVALPRIEKRGCAP